MTPAEKKASELARDYICSEQVNVDDSFTDHKDSFIAGFKAALELAEVKGLEDALDIYKDDSDIEVCEACCDCVSDIYLVETTVPELEPETFGTRAKKTLTAWRSFRGEK